MRKIVILLLTLPMLFSFLTIYAQCTITSFSPASANVGASVTLSGTGFSSTAANNIVYFGSVKATVTSATTTQLVVTVPAQSLAAPISVTFGGGTGQSKNKFFVKNTSLNNPTQNSTSFASGVSFTSSAANYETLGSYATDRMAAVGDFNLDGKSDIVKAGSSLVSVHRNTATSGTISSSSFASAQTFSVSQSPWTISSADIDSDGKLDIITGGSSVVSFLRNTTSASATTFTFVNDQNLTTGGCSNLRIADFDGDGRLDIVVSSSYSSSFQVFLNTSSVGAISFNTTATSINSSATSRHFEISDLNLDGKKDIVGNGSAFINSSTSGSVSFTQHTGAPTGFNFAILDADSDGDDDYVSAGGAIFSNTTSGNTPSFTSTAISTLNGGYYFFDAADYTGDGKPDFLTSYRNSGAYLLAFQNNYSSSFGASTFSSQTFSYGTLGDPIGCDFDGDNKIDVLMNGHEGANFTILRNRIGEDPTITLSGTLTAFSKCSGSVSASQQFTVAGSFLQTGVTITPPVGFEVSTSNTFASSVGTNASPLTVGASGTFSAITVYVRLQATANNATYAAANIVCSSTGATSQNVSCQGTTTSISISGTLSIAPGATTTLTGSGTPAASNPWTSSNTSVATINSSGVVTAVALGTSTITYTNTTGCSVTSSLIVSNACTHTLRLTDTFGDGWNGNTVTLIVGGVTIGTYGSTLTTGYGPIDISFSASSGQSIQVNHATVGGWPYEMRISILNGSNNFIVSNHEISSSPWSGVGACFGPTISLSGTLSAFSKCSGSVSTSQSFSLSGTELTNSVSITPPVGFEVSTTNSFTIVGTNASPLIVTNSGTISSQLIYVRMQSSANNASYAAANIVVTSTNATTQNISCQGSAQVVPSILTTTSGSRCGTGTVILGATASVGIINWYAAATGGTSLSAGTSYTTGSISSTTTYYADAINNGCTAATRSAVVATVNAIPTISSVTPGARCGTGTVSLSAAASAGTINWYLASTGGTSQGTGTSFSTGSISSTTTYYVDATSNGCTTASRTSVTATVNTAPTITSQSTAAQSVCQNATATALSVTATGSGLIYQWYSNATESNVGGTSISGATNASYTPATSSLGTTYYYCIVSGTCSPNATSNVSGVIAVTGPLAGTIAVTGSSTICSGDSKSLSLSGHSGSIQWQSSSTLNGTYTDISGSTEPIFNTGSLSSTTYFRAKLTSGSCSPVYTSSELITVNSLPTLQISGTTTICNGASTTLTASGASTYSWDNGAGSSAAATVQPNSTLMYTVTGTANGCSATATATVTVNTPIYSYNNTGTWGTASNWNLSCDNGATYSVATSEPTTPSIAYVNNGQTVTATALTIASGNQVIVRNGGKLTVNGVLTNNGTLKVESGGSLLQTLGSTQSGSGTYIAEREMIGTGSNTPTGRFWYTGVPMTGAYSTSFLAGGPNKLWSHNEATGSYTEITDDATTLIQTKGYVFRGIDYTSSNNNTYSFSSNNIGNGEVIFNLTRTANSSKPGFNLVANPYPSHLSWNALYATTLVGAASPLLPTVWYRSMNSSNAMVFDTYNYDGGIGTNNSGTTVTGFIAPFQSFWVRVAEGSATATMTATNSMRSHGTQNFLTLTPATVRLNLSNGVSHDETIVFVKEDLSNDYDYRDSDKEIPSATVHQIYSLEGTKKVVINGIANAIEKDTLQLGVQIPTAGTYSINCSELTFSDLVYLEDKLTEAYIQLDNTSTYSFTSEAGTFNNRFVLHFAPVPALPGQTAATAIAMSTSNWPQCNNVSTEDQWHSFTAGTEAVSIAVNTTTSDITIELQDGTGNVVAQENAVNGIGNETLNFYGLTAGQTYKVGVRNANIDEPAGTYGICVKTLKRGGCDYGSGPYSLCQYYKATWAGSTGVSYTFTFTGTSGPAQGQTFTRTQNSDICVLSTVTPLLPYGSTYDVTISNTYTLTDGSGNTEQITVPSNSGCQVVTIAQPQTTLSASSSCNNGPRFRGAVVSSMPWVCGANNWRWRFTEVNPLTLQAVGLPIELNRGAASNFMSLGTLNQLQNGKTYAVQTSPLFTYTASNYQWGPVQYLCIVGAAQSALQDPSEDASQEVSQGSTKDVAQDAAQELNTMVYVTEGNHLNIQLTNTESNTAKRADIYDVTGKLVKSVRLVEGMNTVAIDQASGIYMVRTTVGEKVETQRVFLKK